MSLKSYVKSAVRLLKKKELVPVTRVIREDEELSGKCVVITGGAGEIGFAIACEVARRGGQPVIVGRNELRLKERCIELGDRAGYVAGDVTDVAAIPTIIDTVEGMSVSGRVDALVNAAGVTVQGSFFDISEEGFDCVMATNVKGAFFMCQEAARRMVADDQGGHILNVSSSSALRPAWGPYQISKWAVSGMTKGLADVLVQHGVVVNAVAPGPTATSMLGWKEGDSIARENVPAGRFVMPNEVASLAVTLIGPQGEMVVGDTLYVTGGAGTVTLH